MSEKVGIEKLKAHALGLGGLCLSDVYFNNKTLYLWQCSCGYRWSANSLNVLRKGSWCPSCAGLAPGSLNDLQEFAVSRGGQCLSTKYQGANALYLWKCSEDHLPWSAKANNVLNQGNWCPHCAHKAPLNIDVLKRWAKSKGGECLSTEYTNVGDKYWWRCSENHDWQATATSILHSGSWCPYCAGCAPLSIEILQKHAASKGGKCLSAIYKTSQDIYEWQCSEGHPSWKANASSVLYETWCPYCAGLMPLGIEILQKHAASKGGKCLSTVYKNNRTLYEWQCSEGHPSWMAAANNVYNNGSWCPTCARQSSRSERELREFVRQYYPEVPERGVKGLLPNKKFELDIWMPSLRRAIEFDGEYRHDQPVNMERDARKDAECLQVGIRLLRIRYKDYAKDKKVAHQKVLEFLRDP